MPQATPFLHSIYSTHKLFFSNLPFYNTRRNKKIHKQLHSIKHSKQYLRGRARSLIDRIEMANGPESLMNVSNGWKKREIGSFFCGSPPRYEEVFQMSDFLSCCYLCRKSLLGKDIYMYRGEKAFCSTECRYQQIVSDEYDHDKCESEECRPSDHISSGGGGALLCTDDHPNFFTGILAA